MNCILVVMDKSTLLSLKYVVIKIKVPMGGKKILFYTFTKALGQRFDIFSSP